MTPRPLPTIAALAATVVLGSPPVASAEHAGRPSQPACRSSAHFVIHCDGNVAASYVDGALADFDEAYSRDIAGGGGEPNAGLAAPTDDGDGRTDVYVMTPPGRPDFEGGTVYRDPYHASGRGQAAYVFMTPGLSRSSFRFRAAHEFMHVVLRGYFGMYGPTLEEGFANWAAEHALPDADPGDNNFRSPELPFDCTTPECGMGYWQWLFIERQSEDFGPGFVEALLRRAAASPSYASNFIVPALREELAARIGRPPEEALRLRFAEYARKVWDPAAWRTTAVASIFRDSGQPAIDPDLYLSGGSPETGMRTATVDHLAARYAQLRFDELGQDDDVRIAIVPPPGQLAAPDALLGPAGALRSVPLGPDGAGGFAATLSGPLGGNVAIIPLVNDSETADGQQFSWHAETLAADATMTVPKQRLRTVLKRGLALKVTSNRPIALRLAASVDSRTARRYKLGKRRTRISAINRNSLVAGTTTVRLRITSAARKRLARAKRVVVDVGGRGTMPRGTEFPLGWHGSVRR